MLFLEEHEELMGVEHYTMPSGGTDCYKSTAQDDLHIYTHTDFKSSGLLRLILCS